MSVVEHIEYNLYIHIESALSPAVDGVVKNRTFINIVSKPQLHEYHSNYGYHQ